jgi:hypothetical protein
MRQGKNYRFAIQELKVQTSAHYGYRDRSCLHLIFWDDQLIFYFWNSFYRPQKRNYQM